MAGTLQNGKTSICRSIQSLPSIPPKIDMSVTVLLADNHRVVFEGLKGWFHQTDVEVLGIAADGKEAIELSERLNPQLLISEVTMPRCDGIECLSKLREVNSPTNVLFLTGQTNPTYTARAMALGAMGLINKSIDREPFLEAVFKAANGVATWSEQKVRRHTGTIVLPPTNGTTVMPSLTTRESEVLKQLAFGLSNKEIASALGISYETVKEHVQHVLRKLSVADRTQAAVWAVRNGLA